MKTIEQRLIKLALNIQLYNEAKKELNTFDKNQLENFSKFYNDIIHERINLCKEYLNIKNQFNIFNESKKYQVEVNAATNYFLLQIRRDLKLNITPSLFLIENM